MTEDGLTEYRVEVVGTSLEKKLYSITPKEREEFMRWMNADLELPPHAQERAQAAGVLLGLPAGGAAG